MFPKYCLDAKGKLGIYWSFEKEARATLLFNVGRRACNFLCTFLIINEGNADAVNETLLILDIEQIIIVDNDYCWWSLMKLWIFIFILMKL